MPRMAMRDTEDAACPVLEEEEALGDYFHVDPTPGTLILFPGPQPLGRSRGAGIDAGMPC